MHHSSNLPSTSPHHPPYTFSHCIAFCSSASGGNEKPQIGWFWNYVEQCSQAEKAEVRAFCLQLFCFVSICFHFCQPSRPHVACARSCYRGGLACCPCPACRLALKHCISQFQHQPHRACFLPSIPSHPSVPFHPTSTPSSCIHTCLGPQAIGDVQHVQQPHDAAAVLLPRAAHSQVAHERRREDVWPGVKLPSSTINRNDMEHSGGSIQLGVSTRSQSFQSEAL